MEHQFLQKAFEWVQHPFGGGILSEEEYCSTRDVFQARLDRMRVRLENKEYVHTALFIAILGEIGNNAYDHNLGNWRNTSGTYFSFDEKAQKAIIADRGQGVRKTLMRVKPDISSDTEAIKVAFTEKLSGRTPEQRGNGLKFVKAIVEGQKWSLDFYSGRGLAKIRKGGPIEFSQETGNMEGVIVFIET